jgi:hypothetical protein
MAENPWFGLVEGRLAEELVDHLGDQAAQFASRQGRRSPDCLFGLRIDCGKGPKEGRKCIQIKVHNIL